jgi:hypothetical protein
VVGWTEEDDPPESLRVEGRECLAGDLSGKGITGVWNDQSPDAPCICGLLERLLDHESKLFRVIGVKGSRNGRRSR